MMNTESLDRKWRCVRGEGRYVEDIVPENSLVACFLRSHEAFAKIIDIDLSECLAIDGVVAAYTWKELETSVEPLSTGGPCLNLYSWTPLADGYVRYVGEAIGVVVATTRQIAEDAIEYAYVDLEPLADPGDAELAADSETLLHSETGTNVMFEMSRRDDRLDEAFRNADTIVERSFHYGRQTPLPLETRGVIADVEEPSGNLTVWTSTQVPHLVQDALGKCLRQPWESIRVITPDVGGGFGLKSNVFPEEIVISAIAYDLRQAVCWIEDRSENLTASAHAHDQYATIRLGARNDGSICALDADILVDVGAYSVYPHSGALEPLTVKNMIFGAYAVPISSVRCRGVATAKCPVGPYRGVGYAAACFFTERMLDVLARELVMDPAELRFVNLVQANQMPYTSSNGLVLDNGDYAKALRAVMDRAGYDNLRNRQLYQNNACSSLGIGIAVINEASGPGSRSFRERGLNAIPGYDAARITMNIDGLVTVYDSSAEAGQDHASSISMVASKVLGIDKSSVRVVEGDTITSPYGTGTFGSRHGTAQLSAVHDCAVALKSRLSRIAEFVLGCSQKELVSTGKGFKDRTTGNEVSFERVAQCAYRKDPEIVLPAEFGAGLDITKTFDPSEPTYPYGVHISLIELNTETLSVKALEHYALEDCGVVINPDAVYEQTIGAIVMGIGNVLLEEVIYDTEGQVRTGTLMDYLVPLALDIPQIELLESETETDRTPLGTKGVAEAGTIGAVAAVGAAVSDALHHLGAEELNVLPVNPSRLFNAVKSFINN